MNRAHAAEGLERAIVSGRGVPSVRARYWGAFQQRRKAASLQADPGGMSGKHELMDIGATRGQLDDCACRPGLTWRRRSTGWRSGSILIVLCNAGIFLATSEAGAQCRARDVLQNRLMLKEARAVRGPQVPVRSAVGVPVWKTIRVGTFSNSLALTNAMDEMGCGVGDSAAEILARPAFTVSATTADVGLIAVAVAELGFQTDTASLADIYARARQLGFALVAAEAAPQLRLQYLDQPIGEFLIIGMEPIKTWSGDPVILTVANGGAGLILIGQDGRADAEISTMSRFLFVRANEAPSAKAVHVFDEAAVPVHR